MNTKQTSSKKCFEHQYHRSSVLLQPTQIDYLRMSCFPFFIFAFPRWHNNPSTFARYDIRNHSSRNLLRCFEQSTHPARNMNLVSCTNVYGTHPSYRRLPHNCAMYCVAPPKRSRDGTPYVVELPGKQKRRSLQSETPCHRPWKSCWNSRAAWWFFWVWWIRIDEMKRLRDM